MAIHQLVHTLSYGDAISSEVLALRKVFQSAGEESEIYAINAHPHYKHFVRDFRNLPNDFEGQLVLHYSLGSPLNQLYHSLSTAKKTLVYHNLTPAKWFEGVNPRIAADINQGIAELPLLCRDSQRLLADSAFNAAELQALGFEAQVLELPVDPERWGVERNSGIYNLMKNSGGIHLLHVGRLAPNKCIEDIIKSFYFLHYHGIRESNLWLVGIDIDTELYSFALKRLVDELHLRDVVHFVGCLSDGEVRAMYEASTLYICMSEHEGFCLPLIEAMHFGLPVIAYNSSAVPATLAGAGILINEKRHAELAELMQLIAADEDLRKRMIVSGKERAKALSFEAFEKQASRLFEVLK